MSEWQPIETAPKNGTHLLLFFPHENTIEVGYWDCYYAETGRGYEGCSAWCCSEYQPAAMAFDEPTHWMPLPEPPELEKDNDPT